MYLVLGADGGIPRKTLLRLWDFSPFTLLFHLLSNSFLIALIASAIRVAELSITPRRRAVLRAVIPLSPPIPPYSMVIDRDAAPRVYRRWAL